MARISQGSPQALSQTWQVWVSGDKKEARAMGSSSAFSAAETSTVHTGLEVNVTPGHIPTSADLELGPQMREKMVLCLSGSGLPHLIHLPASFLIPSFFTVE